MRGMEALRDMRRRGLVPGCVLVSTDGDVDRFVDTWHEETPEIAQVLIEPGDNIERLDLRPLIGLKVQVDGSVEERILRVARQCFWCGAKRVISTCIVRASSRHEVLWIEDTAGVVTWK